MKQIKRHKKQKMSIFLVFLGFLGLILLMAYFLAGQDVALLQPKGFISHEQFKLSMTVLAIVLAIGIPSVGLLYLIVWRYRDTNTKATRETESERSALFLFVLWMIPISVGVLISLIVWESTHRLAPQKPISEIEKPLVVKVVAMRWKWLFLYPDQQIASLNYVQIPENTPVRFEVTADDAPMTSFWIPHLSGQIYSMTGHVNRINVMGTEVGDYTGSTPEINGEGFAGMRFKTRVSSAQDFEAWVISTKANNNTLSLSKYDELLLPTEKTDSVFYASYDQNLYDKMLMKYMSMHGDDSETNHERHH
jgi:cytochrome o ubiquinol oxidase subunit 2